MNRELSLVTSTSWARIVLAPEEITQFQQLKEEPAEKVHMQNKHFQCRSICSVPDRSLQTSTFQEYAGSIKSWDVMQLVVCGVTIYLDFQSLLILCFVEAAKSLRSSLVLRKNLSFQTTPLYNGLAFQYFIQFAASSCEWKGKLDRDADKLFIYPMYTLVLCHCEISTKPRKQQNMQLT